MTGTRLVEAPAVNLQTYERAVTVYSITAKSDMAGKFAIGQGILSACGMTDNRVVSVTPSLGDTILHLGSDIHCVPKKVTPKFNSL